MARPVGLQAKQKDNSKKNYRVREEWMQGKRIGRPKQVWVPDESPLRGHWEKVK